MFYTQLTDLLTGKKDDVKKAWIEEFNETGCERAKKGPPKEFFVETIDFIINNFSEIIQEGYDKANMCKVFSQFGYMSFEDGYAMHDLLSALSLLKKRIFRIIDKGGFYDSALDLHKMHQFHTNAVKMFDRANFYTAMGFEEAMRQNMDESSGMDKLLGLFKSRKPKKEVADSCASCKLEE